MEPRFFFIITIVMTIKASEHEKRLLRTLFSTYDRTVRPVAYDNETIVVRIKHTIKQILQVNEREELFVTSGWSSLRSNTFVCLFIYSCVCLFVCLFIRLLVCHGFFLFLSQDLVFNLILYENYRVGTEKPTHK